LTDSGLFVNAMSWVRTPARSEPVTAPMATIDRNHAPMVRHGWRLDALATLSGFSFIVFPLLNAVGALR